MLGTRTVNTATNISLIYGDMGLWDREGTDIVHYNKYKDCHSLETNKEFVDIFCEDWCGHKYVSCLFVIGFVLLNSCVIVLNRQVTPPLPPKLLR